MAAPRQPAPDSATPIVAAFVAPAPIMWAEIMHWRYYSFVYVFFLYALVLHHVDHVGLRRRPAKGLPMRSHIVVVSPSYGGAEKRFFDIFTALRRAGDDVVFVAPTSLSERLHADHPDRADVLQAVHAIPLQGWSRLRFMIKWWRELRYHKSGGHYHYPLNCLWMLHLGRRDRVTMSVADCTSVPGPFARKRTSVWAWVAFRFADRIDVLSPAILSHSRAHATAAA